MGSPSSEPYAAAKRVESVTLRQPSRRISVELDISEKTVKIHRARVMEKMQADSLPELVVLTQWAGLYTTKDLYE